MTDTKPDQSKFFGGGNPSPANESDVPRREPKLSESHALFEVVKVLEQLEDNELRARVLDGVAAFFRIAPGQTVGPRPSIRTLGEVAPGGFSEDRTISPKEFVLQKQPRSEVERVACLAYYLTHYRETPHFKTIDISKLNTDAAQPKFTNASQAVDNATKTNYLAPATKTDLAGYRILHLHTRQMEEIAKHLKELLEVAHKIVEGPVAKTWDDETREYYRSVKIDTEHNDRMYSSVHYVVQPNSRPPLVTIEIQVRTLADEIWGEIDHKLNYPHAHPSVGCREQILALARVTSSCSRLVDAIVTTHEDDLKNRPGKAAQRPGGPGG